MPRWLVAGVSRRYPALQGSKATSAPESRPIDVLTEILAGTEISTLTLLWGVIILAAILRAFTGFGFGLAAVPVFSLFMPPGRSCRRWQL